MNRRHAMAVILAAGPGVALAQGKKRSADEPQTPLLVIAGRYRAEGRAPDGSAYEGLCEIVQQGDEVELTWTIGDGTNRGSGAVEGRVVTVDWGDATPVVYVAMEDGSLHGTWADGTALEKLTPR